MAELGKPLRAQYGSLKPLCACFGRQWLLGPMWFMNIVTLGLILVPGFFWFSSVWATRTVPERILIAPALFAATLISYAYTSWVDPGIVQPGHFAEIEDKLTLAKNAASARSEEALGAGGDVEGGRHTLGSSKAHRGTDVPSSRWEFNPHTSFSYTMRDSDNIEQRICPICGVPQPRGHGVVHVSLVRAAAETPQHGTICVHRDVGACVEEYDHFCPWVNNAGTFGSATTLKRA